MATVFKVRLENLELIFLVFHESFSNSNLNKNFWNKKIKLSKYQIQILFPCGVFYLKFKIQIEISIFFILKFLQDIYSAEYLLNSSKIVKKKYWRKRKFKEKFQIVFLKDLNCQHITYFICCNVWVGFFTLLIYRFECSRALYWRKNMIALIFMPLYWFLNCDVQHRNDAKAQPWKIEFPDFSIRYKKSLPSRFFFNLFPFI